MCRLDSALTLAHARGTTCAAPHTRRDLGETSDDHKAVLVIAICIARIIAIGPTFLYETLRPGGSADGLLFA